MWRGHFKLTLEIDLAPETELNRFVLLFGEQRLIGGQAGETRMMVHKLSGQSK